MGRTTNHNIGENYKKFIINNLKEYKDIVEELYSEFRCSMIHSNSSNLNFTCNKMMNAEMTKSDLGIVININKMHCIIKKFIINYQDQLKKNNNLYDNFIKVCNKLYKENNS